MEIQLCISMDKPFLKVGKSFFAEKVVRHWIMLPREVLESTALEILKKCECGT